MSPKAKAESRLVKLNRQLEAVGEDKIQLMLDNLVRIAVRAKLSAETVLCSDNIDTNRKLKILHESELLVSHTKSIIINESDKRMVSDIEKYILV